MKQRSITLSLLRQAMVLALPSSLALAGPVAESGKTSSKEIEPLSVDGHPMYLGTFNTGIKSSDVYTEGHVSFIVPLWSSYGADGTLGGGQVFLAPYASLGEQGELATSLGLGWRYLFNEQPVSALTSDERAGFWTEGFYVGANVFVDNLRTQFNNDFWQLGVGAEIGTRYLELRGNYYIPFDGGRKLAERTSSTQRFESSSSSTRYETTGSPLSEFNASGHTLGHDVDLTTTAITTTRTTEISIRTITSLYEEGMEGWDVEAVFLIPGLDQYLDVSLLAGYYSFDNQPFGPQRGGSGKTEGWKAGIEIRPVPAIVLTGTWYEDEGLTGSDWVAGIGLQIPLSKDWMDAFKPRRRHLLERMAEPVARQNAAVKVARDFDSDQEVSRSTSTVVRRRVVNRDQRRIVIHDDIVFVNNGGEVGQGLQGGSAAGDGTAESPVDTIQAGADVAAQKNAETQRVWRVYTQGGFGDYNENVTITGSTNFIASNHIFSSTITNETFGTGDRAVVQGGFSGSAASFITGFTTPAYVGMSGYDISGGFNGSGIVLNGIEEISLIDNTVTGTSASNVILENAGEMTVVVTDNSFSNTGNGFGLYIRDVENLSGTIADNTVTSTNDAGIQVDVNNNFNGEFTGNVVTNGNYDNFGDPSPQGSIIFNVGNAFTGQFSNNSTTEGSGYGIAFSAASFEGSFTGNTTDGNTTANSSQGTGIQVTITDDFVGDFSDNTSTNNAVNGIVFDVGGDFTGDFAGNTADNSGFNGIVLTVDGTITGSVTGNSVNGAGDTTGLNTDVIHGFIIQAGNFVGDFSNNTITNAEDHGLEMVIAGNFTGDIFGNDASNNNLDDIVDIQGGLYFDIAGIFAGSVYSNTTNDNGGTLLGTGLSFSAAVFDAAGGTNGFYDNVSTGNTTADISTNVGTIVNGPLSNTSNPGAGIIQTNGEAIATP